MAVLALVGYESGAVSNTIESVGVTGTAPVIGSSPRTGVGCAQAASNAQSIHTLTTSAAVSGRTYWAGMAFRMETNFPTSDTQILKRDQAGSSCGLVRLTTAGVARLIAPDGTDVGGVQLTLGQWHYIELESMTTSSASNDTVRLWVDNVLIAERTAADTTTVGNAYFFGPNSAYGTSRVMSWDDLYVSDDQGSSPTNGRLGPIYIKASLPISDQSRAGWTDNDNTTTNLYQSVDNQPPVGVAPASGAGTADLEIKHSGSSSTDNVVFNMTALGTLVGSSNTILATRCIGTAGLSSATSSTNQSLEVISTNGHPAVSETTVDVNAASGTWPTNWLIHALPLQDNPTITDRTVSPQVEAGKRTATTRVVAYGQIRIDVLFKATEKTGAGIMDRTASGTKAAPFTKTGIAATGTYVNEVMRDSPSAYYRSQESSGLLQDISGNANHATSRVAGAMAYRQSSPITSDTVDFSIHYETLASFSIPDHTTLDHGDTLSVEAWIRLGNLSSTYVISGRGSGALTWGFDGTDDTIFAAKADTGQIVKSTISLSASTWYHVVYTKSGATSKLYIDGVDRTGTVTNQTLSNVAVPLIVGADYNAGSGFFGELDEVAFYSTALTQARVQAHYQAATNSNGMQGSGGDATTYAETGTDHVDNFADSAFTLSNFAGGDENPLSEGGNWGNVNTGTGVVLSRSDTQVAQSGGPLLTVGSHWTPVSFGPNADAWVTIANVVATSGYGFEIGLRVKDEGTVDGWDGYIARYTPSNTTLSIRRITNAATDVVISPQPTTITFASSDRMGLRANGNKFEVWKWEAAGGQTWIRVLEGYDATYQAAGRFLMNVAGNTSPRIDNATAGTIQVREHVASGGDATTYVETGTAISRRQTYPTTITNTTVIDDFNRANESPMLGNWTYPVFFGEDALYLTSNAVTRTPSFVGNAYYNAASYGPDCEVTWKVSTKPGTDGELITFMARIQNTGTSVVDAYAVRLIPQAGTDIVRLRRWTDGATTNLVDFNQEVSNGDYLGIRCVSHTIEAWYRASAGSWTKLGSVSDATEANRSGRFGLELALGAGVSVVDDMSGGNITVSYAGSRSVTYTKTGTAISRHQTYPTTITTPVLDTFTGSDETPITTNWTAPLVVGDNSARRLSNRFSRSASGGWSGAYYDLTTFGPDSEAYHTIVTTPTTSVTVWARAQAPGTSGLDGYLVNWDVTTNQIRIQRTDNGASTTIAGPFSKTDATGDKLGIRVIGNRIEAWVLPVSTGLWELVGSATDYTYTTAGSLAAEIQGSAGDLDDFGGGTITVSYAGASAVTYVESGTAIANLPNEPVTSVLTSFTGSDEEPLSEGGAWTGSTIRTNTATRDPMRRATNQAARASSGQVSEAVYNTVFGPDTEVYFTVPTLGASGTDVSLHARINNPDSSSVTSYQFVHTLTTLGWEFYRLSNTTFTQIGTTTATPALSAGDSMMFRVIGTRLYGFYKPSGGAWRPIAEFTDTNVTGTGRPGMNVSGAYRIDDYGGGTIRIAGFGSSGADATTYNRSGTAISNAAPANGFTASGGDATTYVETGTAISDFVASGADATTSTEIGRAISGGAALITATNVRRFVAGSGDVITLALGSTGFPFGAGTALALVNPSAGGANTVFSAGATNGASYMLQTDTTTTGVLLRLNGTAVNGSDLLVNGNWYLVGATKASGTATPRLHIYDCAAGTWTHENASGTLANSSTPVTRSQIGFNPAGTTGFSGDISFVAVHNRVLSDADFDALTSLVAVIETEPVGMWVLDQANVGTSVTDYVGNGADQTSISGTSVQTGTVANFDRRYPSSLTSGFTGGGVAEKTTGGATYTKAGAGVVRFTTPGRRIANVRSFNGSSDEIQFALDALAGAWGDTTVACISKGDSTDTGPGTVLTIQDTLQVFIEMDSAYHEFYDYSTFQSWSAGTIGLDVWTLSVWTKASGSANPRRHAYHYSINDWDHDDYTTPQPNLPSSSSPVRMGNNQFSQFFKGLIAVVGVWKGRALNDTEVEELIHSIDAWDALSPTALWLLDQASTGTSVLDRINDSDQSSISGTSVVSETSLPFDVVKGGDSQVTYVEAGTAISEHVASGADAVTFAETGNGISPRTVLGDATSTLNRTGTAYIGPVPFGMLLDAFTGSDQNPISGNWSTPLGGPDSNMRRLSNQLAPTTGGAFNNAWWNAATYGPDVEVFATIPVLPDPGQPTDVWARIVNPGTSSWGGYLAVYAGPADFYIGKIVNGSFTSLAGTGSITLSAGDKIALRCVGARIEGWTYKVSEGIWTYSTAAIDTSHTGAGYIGAEIYHTVARLDDFGGTTLGGMVASGDAASTLNKSGTAIAPFTASGGDATTYAEAGTCISPRVASGADAVTFSETGAGIAPFTILGDAVSTLNRTGAGISERVGSGTDAVTFVETGMGVVNAFVASGDATTASVKLGLAKSDNFIASGADSVTYVEMGTDVSERVASGADAHTASETGSGVAPFTASATRSVTTSKFGACVSEFVGSGADVVTSSETGTGISERVASGARSKTSARTGTGIADFTASGTRQKQASRTGTAVAEFTASGDANIAFAETGAGIAPFVASGTSAKTASRTNAAISAFVASGGDATTYAETGTAIVNNFVASAADSVTSSETGTGITAFTAASPGDEVQANTGAGIASFTASGTVSKTSSQSGTAVADFTTSGADATTYSETGTAILNAVASGVSSTQFGTTYTKSGAAEAAFTASGDDATTSSETGAGVAPFTGSGARSVERFRAGTGVADFTASGTDAFTAAETGSATAPFTGDGASAITYVESGTCIAPFTGSGTRAKTSTQSGTAISGFVGSGADACTFAETGACVLVRTCSGADACTFGEAGTGLSVRVADADGRWITTEAGIGVIGATCSGSATKQGEPTGSATSGFTGTADGQWTLNRAGSGVAARTGSGSDSWTNQDTGAATAPFTASGTRAVEHLRTGAAISARVASGDATWTLNRSGTGILNAVASATPDYVLNKSGVGVIGFVASGATAQEGDLVGSATSGFTASGARSVTRQRSGAGVINNFVASGSFAKTAARTGTGIIGFVTTGTQAGERLRVGTAIITFTDSGTRELQLERAGTGIIVFTGTAARRIKLRKGYGRGHTTLNLTGRGETVALDTGQGTTTSVMLGSVEVD